jgi:hypothetical protein
MIPFVLEDPASITTAIEVASRSSVPVSFSTIFSKSTPEGIVGLKEILQKGRPVDIEIQTSITDVSLEGFEEFLTRASAELEGLPPIILCEWSFRFNGTGHEVLWMDDYSQSPPTSS